MSQVPVDVSIRSATLVKTPNPLGEIIILFGLEGIHGSVYILILSPEPTLQMYPRLNVGIAATRLCQVNEEPAFGPADKIS
jgi:hypothetical protein